MSTSFQPRRAIPSALNTPTEVRITGGKSVPSDEAERILTEFIDASELISSGIETSNATSTGLSDAPGNGPILAQLRRIQRDLRGLPPLVAEMPTTNKRGAEDDEATLPVNKKIKFEDEDEEQASNTEEKNESSSNSEFESDSNAESKESSDTSDLEVTRSRESNEKKDSSERQDKKRSKK